MFTVDRFGGSDGTVTVAYTTQDATAVAGTDYTATSGTLTFAPGVTSQTLSIPTLVDPNASGSLSLDLVLQAPTGGATLGLTDIAALTITPAPPPTTLTVTPVAGTYGATANFSATLTAAGAPVAGEPVTFTITADGQTSTLGTATTDANGVASLSGVSLGSLPAGTYPGAVSASFGGDASDAGTAGSGDLSIAQAAPTVTWVTPADITQGQPLGAAQLEPRRRCRAPSPTRRPPGRCCPRAGRDVVGGVHPHRRHRLRERERQHDAECPEPNEASGRDGGESNGGPDHGRHTGDDHRHEPRRHHRC